MISIQETLLITSKDSLATFSEKMTLVAGLGLQVLPSEDLQTRKIQCRFNLVGKAAVKEQTGFAKITFGGDGGTIGRTFELVFELKC